MITVAWADDNKKFREHILGHLDEVAGTWLDVIAVTNNGEELLSFLSQTQTDIVLLDIRMPRMDGIQTAKLIREKYPEIKIIAFTEFDFEANVAEMYKIGVKSFVAKSKPQDLVRAIKIVNEGGVYLPDSIANVLQNYLNELTSVSTKLKPSISDSEALILKYICEGKSSAEIGDFLCRSPRTIEEYREKLYKKFDVKKKEELIVMAVRQNLY
jgi:DNA-binding NarL/FixJ family response regulator